MAGESGWGGSETVRSGLSTVLAAKEKGAVFIDLLLGLCFSLVILASLQQLASTVYTVYNCHANQAELQYSARMALDSIEKDVRCARDFQVSADGKKLMITDLDDQEVCFFVRNKNLYREDVSCTPVAENLWAVHFQKTAEGLQGKLQLKNSASNYSLDFYCFARALKDQG